MKNLETHLALSLPSPMQTISPKWKGLREISLSVKRDDLIHPIISGNKFRKLRSTLTEMPDDVSTIVSFGGGFSNHIHALAYCCMKLNKKLVAYIRGNYPTPTPMLEDISQWGAQIVFVTKAQYQRRHEPKYIYELNQKYPNAIVVPEGGSMQAALSGVADMVNETSTMPPDFFISPVASGATLAGIASALHKDQKAIGVGVLKGEGYLEDLVRAFLPIQADKNWHIDHRFHFGGYAKNNDELINFCLEFNEQTGIAIEPVYSGKLFFALRHMIENGEFATGSHIVAVHTGGLQGNRK